MSHGHVHRVLSELPMKRYSSCTFTFTETRDALAGCMQLAEIKLFGDDPGNPISMGPASVDSGAPCNPGAEPSMVVDGMETSKWCHRRTPEFSCENVQPGTRLDRVALTLPLLPPQHLVSYKLFTANNHAEWDPVGWTLTCWSGGRQYVL